jgi:dCMP deaminase
MSWDNYFLDMAALVATRSKDPSTRVGAIIVRDRTVLATGYNGFPRGIADTPERLNDRDTKLKLVVHGELNAVLQAAREGISLKNSSIYVVAIDAKTGDRWGGPPCIRCTVECIQAGIIEYVSHPLRLAPERWHASCHEAGELIHEAGLRYREVELSH